MADAKKIQAVARRIAGAWDSEKRVVAVVSAMGDTTDELIALASQVSNRPAARELDLLLSSGEVVSCTLMAMALRFAGIRSHRPYRAAGGHSHRYCPWKG